MNVENVEKEQRERFVTCSEESLEEMENFVDDMFKDIGNSDSEKLPLQNMKEKVLTKSKTKKRGRPNVKTSEKQISKKINENQKKRYGFVPRRPIRINANEKESLLKAKIVENKQAEKSNKESKSRETNEQSLTNAHKIDTIQVEEGTEENESEDEKSPPAKVKRTETIHTGNDKAENEEEDDVFLYDANHLEEPLPNKECIDCNQMYSDKKEKIKKSCKICKSNAHGCIKEGDHKKSKGDAWLCGDCVQFIDSVDRKHPDLFQDLKNTLLIKGKKRKRTESNSVSFLSSKTTGETQSKKVHFESPLSLYDISIKKEDIESLKEGQWISDNIIALWFEHLKDGEYKDNQNIIFIQPSVTQVLKQGPIDDLGMLLEPLNIWQKKYIFMAVNDNKLNKAGGQHWSLLVYTIKENIWYHFDSLNNLNLKEARFLVGRLQEYLRPGTTPRITTATCSQQENNFDCGAYTMIYAQKIADKLVGEYHTYMSISKCLVDKKETKALRNKIHSLISKNIKFPDIEEIDKNEGNKKKGVKRPNDVRKKAVKRNEKVVTEEEILPKSDENLQNPEIYPNLNKDKICFFLTKGSCRYGARGENHLGKCKNYHPEQCRNYNLNGTMEKGCHKGEKCDKWHPTYFCYLSINSKTCSRQDCSFKHHRNCIVTSSENNFLVHRNQNKRNLHQDQQRWTHFNHRQQPRQQYYQQNHQNHQQFQEIGNSFHPHRLPNNQFPQMPYNHLKQMIQSVILEMNTNLQ